MIAKLTAIAALFTLAAPVARGAVHNVTVGGTGILKYDPEFIVRIHLCSTGRNNLLTQRLVECRPG